MSIDLIGVYRPNLQKCCMDGDTVRSPCDWVRSWSYHVVPFKPRQPYHMVSIDWVYRP